MTNKHPALEPAMLGPLRLKNRIIKAGTFENMTPNGMPGDTLLRFHTGFAEGGIAMTTIGYCAVSKEGALNANMLVMDEAIRTPLENVISAIHARNCKVSGQMGHCGAFSKNRSLNKRPKGASGGLNILGISEGMWIAETMTLSDIQDMIEQYRKAARFMKSVGFDALEIHFGHGYGLCQFLSPLTNRRKDQYGGSMENRLRLPLEVLAAVREEVGKDFPILGKISMTEGRRGGLDYEDAMQIAIALDQAGIDGIVTSGGTSTMNPMLMFRGPSILPALLRYETNRIMRFLLRLVGRRMFPSMPFSELYFIEQAKRIQKAVKCKIIYIGGACSGQSLQTLLDSGFDFFQLGRSLLADPDFADQLSADRNFVSRCKHCNKCVGTIESPKGIHCPEFYAHIDI
ncbi:NADH:flavin oxidoreductase [Spongiibacter sp. KMU-158]|uniref:NADH:flavin oxidoreductase n=1 Tax=Spongiibacter pelagi TaxID=2760804 RepID=A0A927C5B9_9GAMM|nr:NADH:flavin oxidoreductase [Spongiibacter pelagi]MBD2859856.1 NADH:flavin oxidoreductase [Spongiibacter pelagi]